MNFARVPIKYSPNLASTSGAYVGSMSNDFGNEERFAENLSVTYRKEDLSIYKPRSRSFSVLNQIQNEFGFLESIVLSTASSSQHATLFPNGAIWFYVLPFKFRLLTPLSRFIRTLFLYFDLALGKFMPNCWRTILAIQNLENIHGFQLDPCILINWYHVKENTHKRDRNMLNALTVIRF